MSTSSIRNSDILEFCSCFTLSNKKEEIQQIPFFTVSLKKKDKQSLKCVYLLNSNEKTNETVNF